MPLLCPARGPSADLCLPAPALPGHSEDFPRPSGVTVSRPVSASNFTAPESHPALWVGETGVVIVLLPLAGEGARLALGSELPSVGSSCQHGGQGLALGFFWSGLQVHEPAGGRTGPPPRQACWHPTLDLRAAQPASTLIPRYPCVLPGHGCHPHDSRPETHLRSR